MTITWRGSSVALAKRSVARVHFEGTVVDAPLPVFVRARGHGVGFGHEGLNAREETLA
jgi:hypothetical protein